MMQRLIGSVLYRSIKEYKSRNNIFGDLRNVLCRRLDNPLLEVYAMSRRTYLIVMLLQISIVLIIISGCIAYEAEDGTTKYKLAPGMDKQIEEGGEGVLNLLTLLSPLLGPAGGLAIGGVATGLAVFKKVKPKLTEAQSKYELSNTVAGIAVEAIEQIKKDNPKQWDSMAEKLQKECEECGIDTRIVKNFIRGLRGLPTKT